MLETIDPVKLNFFYLCLVRAGILSKKLGFAQFSSAISPMLFLAIFPFIVAAAAAVSLPFPMFSVALVPFRNLIPYISHEWFANAYARFCFDCLSTLCVPVLSHL